MSQPLLVRASARFYRQHPWQLALVLLGVASGVAAVVAIELVNASAERAFRWATDAVTGKATHQIVATGGAVPETLYRRLRVAEGLRASAPVVEATVSVDHAEQNAPRATLLGVDPFAEAALARPATRPLRGGQVEAGTLIARAGTCLISEPLAQELGLRNGDRLNLRIDGRRVSLEVLGVWASGSAPGRQRLIVTDIATAQESLQRVGELSRIDLVLGQGEIERLEELLPPDLRLRTTAARDRAILNMTRAFRVNLTALSLLALLVGAFLIYNTLRFMVVQRRSTLGTLRAIGATGRELLAVVLGEALVLGSVGALLGLAAGWLLATELVDLVTRTINDLYFRVDVAGVTPAPAALAKGLALGLGAAVIAALAPAREAARTAPRRALSRADTERRARRLARRGVTVGLILLALAPGLIWAAPRSLIAAFAGLFALVAGYALLVPWLTAGASGALARVLGTRLGPVPRLAVGGVRSGLSRTGVAVAALTVAVAAVIGVGLMIASFRASVADWLEHNLNADFYVDAEGSGTPLPPGLIEDVRGLDSAGAVSLMRWRVIETERGLLRLAAVDLPRRAWEGYRIVRGSPERAWAGFRAGEGVLISESYAYRHDLRPGDSVVLPTSQGPQALPVLATYRDYRSEHGVITLPLSTYRRLWKDPVVTGLAVYARNEGSIEPLGRALRRLTAGDDALQIEPAAAIRRNSMAVFDRTFTVTGVLRAVAGAVAFAGVLGALLALQLERARELGVLRALGVTPGEIRALVTGQSALLGGFAALGAVPLGITLAWLLIDVVNRRAFGWGMGFELAPGELVPGIALALAAALLAAVYPAHRAAHLAVARILREEPEQ